MTPQERKAMRLHYTKGLAAEIRREFFVICEECGISGLRKAHTLIAQQAKALAADWDADEAVLLAAASVGLLDGMEHLTGRKFHESN